MGNAVAARKAAQPPVTGQALRILKDEKLAAMVGAGSDDAFATLYRRHHQAVYRYSLSLLRQEADARDALQSTMLAALTSLRARPLEGAFKPWLFRITHNQSISIIRGRTREAPEEAAPPPVAADDRDTRERFRTLVSDLGALPERQRGAIVMRELSGLSYAEIGAALETSEAAGKQLVYEARSALHDLRAGHEMSCELVRERISANDRRLLRGRMVRAHLRGCEPCQDFEQAIRRRRTALAAFAPPLAPLAAAAILQDVFSGGGGVGGAGGAGVATGATGFTGGGLPLAGPAALKAVAVAAVTAAAGVGAYSAANSIFSDEHMATQVAQAQPDASAKPAGPAASRDGGSGASQAASARAGRSATRAEAGGGTTTGATDGAGSGGASSDGLAENSPAENAPSGTSGATNEPGGSGAAGPDGGDSAGGGGGDQPGSSPTPPGSSSPPDSPSSPPGPAVDPPPSGGGSGEVAPGTPPGHGGTPPGHGGSPPGRSSGGTPPGQLGNPGRGGGPGPSPGGRGHGHS